MSISIRVNEAERSMIKGYADLQGLSISDAVKLAVFEKIENEFDIKIYERSMKQHVKDGKTYSHEEMLGQIGL